MKNPFSDLEVASVFDNYPLKVRKKLLQLRDLIFYTASHTEGVGKIEETLKWGQPAYLTPETKSGTTIRIDQIKKSPGKYAIYFHCQTNLIETFRKQYPKNFDFEDNRAIILKTSDPLQKTAISGCIRQALTYHKKN